MNKTWPTINVFILNTTKFYYGIMCGLITCIPFFFSLSHADEVVMTTGERFVTSKVWEENGKIHFSMQGLVVNVHKSDVAAIIGSNGTTEAETRSNSYTPPQMKSKQPQNITTPSIASKPALPLKSRKTSKQRSKITGIGFNGISWHMQPTDLPGLKKIKTEPVYGGIDQYWRPDGPMTLGDLLLDGLVFGFWQNRLYSIMIWVDGKNAYNDLQRVILKRYGTGQRSKKHQNRHVWVKDKTTDRMLEYDETRNVGIFWMRSRDLDAHIKKQYPES